jgi:hypothetical protein
VNVRRVLAGVALVLLVVCTRSSVPAHRAELRRVSGDAVQIIPSEGQLPYCLVFTQSEKGVIRQLTISKTNNSVKCDPGEPVLGQTYKIPSEEGPVKIRVFFSDQRLEAASVANQLNEMSNPSFNPIDFRLPGKVIAESIDFIPAEGPAPAPGQLVPKPSQPAATNRPG